MKSLKKRLHMITSAQFENVKWAARQKGVTILWLGENKGADESFGCFNSQVMADRADSSDFQVSRTTAFVERHIRNHETNVASADRKRNVGTANTKRGGLSVRKSGSVWRYRRASVLLSFSFSLFRVIQVFKSEMHVCMVRTVTCIFAGGQEWSSCV